MIKVKRCDVCEDRLGFFVLEYEVEGDHRAIRLCRPCKDDFVAMALERGVYVDPALRDLRARDAVIGTVAQNVAGGAMFCVAWMVYVAVFVLVVLLLARALGIDPFLPPGEIIR